MTASIYTHDGCILTCPICGIANRRYRFDEVAVHSTTKRFNGMCVYPCAAKELGFRFMMLYAAAKQTAGSQGAAVWNICKLEDL